MRTTDLTGGKVESATRIDAACWLDGNDDEIIVEFWHMSGSIIRTQYDRRTTRHELRFIPVDCEAFDRMMKFAEGQNSNYCI